MNIRVRVRDQPLTRLQPTRSHVRMSQNAWVPADDQPTIVALQGGSRAALAELYERHHGYLLAIGLKMLRSPAEAEDVLHNVFVEVWQRAGDYRPDKGSVRTWLAVRMRSRCLDYCRSVAYSRSDSLEPGFEPPTHFSSTKMPALVDAQRAAVAVSELPDEQRMVMELGYFRGFSSTEIADELDIPTGTVKSRVRAAIGKLRSRMEDSR